MFMGEKILVTGGAGFVGSHICERLVAEGKEIVIVDNLHNFYDPKIKLSNLKGLAQNPNVTILNADIRDANIQSELSKFEISSVLHVAAIAGVRPSMLNPGEYIDINVKGTLNILEFARKADADKFIFSSSSSVYGDVPLSELPVAETVEPKPISPYAASKLGAEILCNTYLKTFGLDTTILRYFTVYGPRQRPDEAISKFTSLILKNQPIEIFGNGEQQRDFTYVSDAVEGTLLALRSKNCSGETINIAGGKRISVNELVKIISNILGSQPRIIFSDKKAGEASNTHADISKAEKILGYKPKVSMEEGIRNFVQWFKSQQI